jgi:hypothetical protein
MNASAEACYSAYTSRYIPAASEQMWVTRRNDELTPAQELVSGRNLAMISAVERAIDEAFAEGIDVPLDVLESVARLVSLLPSDLPVAESVYVSQNGCFNFDWDEDSQNQLSIMVPSAGSLAFAAYDEGDRTYGTYRFGAQLPHKVAAAACEWTDRFNKQAVRT